MNWGDERMNDLSAMINMEELLEIMDNDTELMKECFNNFIEDCPGTLTDIRSAIETSDAPLLAERAHKLKGSMRYLAAVQVADIAYQLEIMGKEGDLERSGETFRILEEQCDKLKDLMLRYNY